MPPPEQGRTSADAAASLAHAARTKWIATLIHATAKTRPFLAIHIGDFGKTQFHDETYLHARCAAFFSTRESGGGAVAT
jgi:hypothetical protein